jgi:hypothetical protein
VTRPRTGQHDSGLLSKRMQRMQRMPTCLDVEPDPSSSGTTEAFTVRAAYLTHRRFPGVFERARCTGLDL